MVMEFKILHPSNGRLNSLREEGVVYKEVASIIASNLEEVFTLSQNDFNPEYRKLGIRSTSVGDIIIGNGVVIISNVGFWPISKSSYKILEYA